MARKVIMMSEEEYNDMTNKLDHLYEENYWKSCQIEIERQRREQLYDFFNRPAIEASEKLGDLEFYSWCNEKAKEYEKAEEEKWVNEMAEYYNSPLYDFAQRNGLGREEAKLRVGDLQTKCACGGYISQAVKSEGWSDLHIYKWGPSWIMHRALNDIYDRKEAAEKAGDEKATQKYREMYLTWYAGMTSDEIGRSEYSR